MLACGTSIDLDPACEQRKHNLNPQPDSGTLPLTEEFLRTVSHFRFKLHVHFIVHLCRTLTTFPLSYIDYFFSEIHFFIKVVGKFLVQPLASAGRCLLYLCDRADQTVTNTEMLLCTPKEKVFPLTFWNFLSLVFL